MLLLTPPQDLQRVEEVDPHGIALAIGIGEMDLDELSRDKRERLIIGALKHHVAHSRSNHACGDETKRKLDDGQGENGRCK